ncbi:MAG: VWA domain-containing protein [Planctomycetaceae bacterium]
MGFSFINMAMLLGLAGIALPFLVHLLSRRKFDVVEWGAMQFLELSQKTRRRLRLEELLLLLLRMGLIAIIAFALARPWISGGVFSKLVSNQPRDVVFVIDGSYSMGWEGGVETPHATATKWVHDFLESLNPGDSISVIDARDVPRAVVDPPTQDFGRVREVLDNLPTPSGSSDLPTAMSMAVQVLSRTSNMAREVIVLTDKQKVPWEADDASLWRRFDDLLTQPTVKPGVWVVDVSAPGADKQNFAIGDLNLSRDLSVPDFPLRIQTTVRSFGSAKQQSRRVHLEVNGQRITEKTISCTIPAGGEAPVEFEVKLPSVGSWLLSVVLDSDELPGDNRADAAITVADAVPVLIVDGAWSADPTERESFFARAALTSSENNRPWVKAESVSSTAFQTTDLEDVQTVILANVPSLHDQQVAALKEFVARGGGLLICPGDNVNAEDWNSRLYEDGRSILPGLLQKIDQDRGVQLGEIRPMDKSLQLPWVKQFRAENGGGFTDARIAKWWQLLPPKPLEPGAAADESEGPVASDTTVVARLNTNAPLLLSRQYGKGRVLMQSIPLDADWGSLPMKGDYVAYLHEVIFHLASAQVSRNVAVGSPLVQPVTLEMNADDFEFVGPDDTTFEVETGGDELRPTHRLSDTSLPGTYELRSKKARKDDRGQFFVVSGDRRESDLVELEDKAVTDLQAEERLKFVDGILDLKQQMFEKESPTELWKFLLLIFVGFLVAELLLTRRLVRGGHVPDPDTQLPTPDETYDEEELDEVDEYDDIQEELEEVGAR